MKKYKIKRYTIVFFNVKMTLIFYRRATYWLTPISVSLHCPYYLSSVILVNILTQITRLIFFGFKDFAKTIYSEYNIVIRL